MSHEMSSVSPLKRFSNHSHRRSSSSSKKMRRGARPQSAGAIPSFCFNLSIKLMRKERILRFLRLPFDSALVSYYQASTAHGPAILLVNEQRVKILFGPALLLDPGLSPVARTQDDAAASHDPAFVFIHELNTQQRRTRW